MATIHALDPGSRGPQPAAHFDGILEQSRNLICERLDEAVAAMLDHAKDTLSALITGTRNFEERRLYEETRAVVMGQREDMTKQFRTSYLGEFRRRADRARKIGQPAGASDESLERLELVGEDDFEETLKFNNMAGKLRAYCDEELVALDQRVGVLLGDANLQANDNPFSPQVICDAYKQACRQVDAGVAVRRVLLKLFDDHVLDDVRSMYKAVNALLVQNSILPKIRYGVSRSQDRRAPGRGAATDADAPAGAASSDVTTTAAQDLFTILQNLAAQNAMAMGRPGVGAAAGIPGAPAAAGFAGAPVGAFGMPAGLGGAPAGGFAAGPSIPVLQGADLQRSLTQIQLGNLSGVIGGNLSAVAGNPGTTNVLQELRSTSVGAGMGSMDLMTLDIVSMLFDQLFDDPKTPNGVKGLFGRLQIPMLKVAIADKSFFSTKAHPARKLLDTLGEVALRLPPDFNPNHPLFSRLQGILEELVEGFRDSMEIFASVRERVEALLSEEDMRIDQEARAAARRVEEMEHLAVAKRAAAEEVKARVDAHKLPPPVREFLIQQWLKLLLLVHVKEGRKSETWQGGLEAMDQLIWSIEPKAEREERRKVVAMIPGLVRKLAVGLKAAGIDDDVRKQFFAHLIKYHKQAITVPGESAPDAEAAPVMAGQAAEQGAVAHHSGPAAEPAAEPAAAAQEDASLDFTAPVEVKNPFGEGNVKVENLDMDFTSFESGAAPTPARRATDSVNPLATLVVGMWVEFREKGEHPSRRSARLIFVTPRKTRYLFAFDRVGKDILPYTPGEISRRFRLGEAVFIEEPRTDSLFDRIMKGLVGKLKAPAAAQ